MELLDVSNDIIETILDQKALSFNEIKQFAYYRASREAAQREMRKRTSVMIVLKRSDILNGMLADRAEHLVIILTYEEFFKEVAVNPAILEAAVFTFVVNFENVFEYFGKKMDDMGKIMKMATKKRMNVLVHRSSKADLHALRLFMDVFGEVAGNYHTKHKVKLLFNDYLCDEFREYKTLALSTNGLKTLSLNFNDATDLTIEISEELETLSTTLCSMFSRLYLDTSVPNNLKKLELKLCINFNYASLRNLHELNELSIVSSEIDMRELRNITLPNLKVLRLVDNDLSNLNFLDWRNFAPNLKSLTIINQDGLLRCSGVKLPIGLEHLNLSNNSILNIENIDFSGLKTLILSKNKLRTIVPPSPESRPNLQFLDLSQNEMLIRDAWRFTNYSLIDFLFSNIVQLKLDGCNINDVDLEGISDMYEDKPLVSKLEDLLIGVNKLSNLRCFRSKFFMSLPLKRIDLSHNKFTYLNDQNFPVTTETHPSVHHLDFSQNFNLSRVYNLHLDHRYLDLNFQLTGVNEILSSLVQNGASVAIST